MKLLGTARLSHWGKNVAILPGCIMALYIGGQISYWQLGLGILCACLISSSNYVLNEILDARTDASHPSKKNRPLACGEVDKRNAWLFWILMFLLGIVPTLLFLNFNITRGLFALWVAGILYNTPPVRLKDTPYLDIISESINNPIRFCIGWSMVSLTFPPVTVLISYWCLGAILMTLKRIKEYRLFATSREAAAYRKSFGYYNTAILGHLTFEFGLVAALSGAAYFFL